MYCVYYIYLFHQFRDNSGIFSNISSPSISPLFMELWLDLLKILTQSNICINLPFVFSISLFYWAALKK